VAFTTDHHFASRGLRIGVLLGQRPDLLRAVVEVPGATVVAVARDRAEPEDGDTDEDVGGPPCRRWPERGPGTRERREAEIAEWFRDSGVELVVAAGWLWLLSPRFLDAFPDRVVNVHPTLLPAFPGRHSVERAVQHGVRVHGVTVHRIDEGVDTGAILAQRALPVVDGADAREVRRRLAPLEQALLADVVGSIAFGGSRHPVEALPPGAHEWLLTAAERGNVATRLGAWTEGNAVRRLVHGRQYFEVLAETLDRVGPGDLVLFAGWRGDGDERLTDAGPTVADALVRAAQRQAVVRGLLWRSHSERLGYSAEQNRRLAHAVAAAGGEVLLDQRVRPFGSHHQKLVVIRRRGLPRDDVAFLGGIDLAYSRRDDAGHAGDVQVRPFADAYGRTPAWHDAHLEIRGPAVRDVEDTFRERWEDSTPLSRRPWQVVSDRLWGLARSPSPLPLAAPIPAPRGSCAVQVLRTYPSRRSGFPFAPEGERSVARAYAKALRRARKLIYIEDQYLWSSQVARVFADALRRSPELQLVAVAPRYPDQEGGFEPILSRVAQVQGIKTVLDAGGDRVQILDVERRDGTPIYVHAKVCVIDDVWATVGSDNFNRRSWTHDSEATVAVLDGRHDEREPRDPGGLGDGARLFPRELRLELMREHLERVDDTDFLDPVRAADAVRRSAAALDSWYADGCRGPRPPGRLRRHRRRDPPSTWRTWALAPAYFALLDPDGRPWRLKLRRQL
jgi:folate-dependent phosphoribosylglycinamide formyltransferase PurN/phosphatidylserine/phosphatidylglycerophosphate/cardiolipin synthase-like enzyme